MPSKSSIGRALQSAMDQTTCDKTQQLAEFMRNVAYSKKMFHHTDHWLTIEKPRDDNNEILYKGCIYDRTIPMSSSIIFLFSEENGIRNIKIRKDNASTTSETVMELEPFFLFVKEFFGIEDLYSPPREHGKFKKRPPKDTPSIQELSEFIFGVCEGKRSSKPCFCHIGVLHPRDNYNDLSFSGGIWNDEPSRSKKYRSASFTYSKSQGIHNFQMWIEHISVQPRSHISFSEFREVIEVHFK